jgi:hypothetical protein
VGVGFVVDILSLAISPPSPIVTEIIFPDAIQRHGRQWQKPPNLDNL